MNQKEKKPIPPEYQFWRNRIEGQLRHTMHEHPEWFNLPDDKTRDRCVSSTAKRIIGEIVAGTRTGNDSNNGATACAVATKQDDVQLGLASSGEVGGISTANLLHDQPSTDLGEKK